MNTDQKQRVFPGYETRAIEQQLSYRAAMAVKELAVFPAAFGQPAYYVCPRCDVTMEREYQSYCDRCGQRLAWRGKKQIRLIYPRQKEDASTQTNQANR